MGARIDHEASKANGAWCVAWLEVFKSEWLGDAEALITGRQWRARVEPLSSPQTWQLPDDERYGQIAQFGRFHQGSNSQWITKNPQNADDYDDGADGDSQWSRRPTYRLRKLK